MDGWMSSRCKNEKVALPKVLSIKIRNKAKTCSDVLYEGLCPVVPHSGREDGSASCLRAISACNVRVESVCNDDKSTPNENPQC